MSETTEDEETDPSTPDGCDRVSTDVILETHEEYPHKCLIFKWCQPEEKPEQYSVVLYKGPINSRSSVREFTVEIYADRRLEFDELKDQSKYHCCITAKYPNGEEGIGVYSNEIETERAPPRVSQPKNVSIRVNSGNPAHEIIVDWEKPEEKLKITHYEVYLIDQHGKAVSSTIDVNHALPPTVMFRSLKSNTTHKACVTTVAEKSTFSRSLKSEKILSQPVTTAPATHRPGFDIRKDGEPIIKTCRAERLQHGYEGFFEWAIADIGDEEFNYELKIGAWYREKNTKKSKKLKLKDSTCIEPVQLISGKTYIFVVTSTYRQFDTDNLYDVEAFGELRTEMKEPEIGSIECKFDLIMIQWKPAEGALHHKLKILDDQDQEIPGSEIKDLDIPIEYRMTGSCRYGRVCCFVIEAHGQDDECRTARSIITIGGDTVVTNLRGEIGRREIRFTWKKPENGVTDYEIQICESNGVEQKHRKPFRQTESWYLAEELKSKHRYRCSVRPLHENAYQPSTISEWIETPQWPAEAIEKDENFGKPEDISAKISRNTGDKCIIKVAWSAVDPGKNYHELRYRVTLHQVGRFLNTSFQILNKKLKMKMLPSNITEWEFGEIATGHRYQIELLTSFHHIDDGSEKKFANTYPVDAEMKKVLMEDKIEYSHEQITFKWDRIPDAKTYKIILKCAQDTHPRLTQHITENVGICHVTMTKDFRIGQSCWAMVSAFIGEREFSKSDWKYFFIGDDKCPRNVETSYRGFVRSLNISFDKPSSPGVPKKYKIEAVPGDGSRRKTHQFSGTLTSYTFHHLKSNTEYYFEISALWDDWSISSRSNYKTTKKMTGEEIGTTSALQTSSFLRHEGDGNVNVELRDASVSVKNVIVQSSPAPSAHKDFSTVRKLKAEISKEKLTMDDYLISWAPPRFEDDSDSDYCVMEYVVTYQKESNTTQICDRDLEHRNQCSQILQLDHGFMYTVSVQTVYEVIDGEAPNFKQSENVEKVFFTRPDKPEIVHCFVDTDERKLHMEWKDSIGAKSFRVNMYTNDSKEPALTKDVGRQNTYERNLDVTLGYGMKVIAKVIANGAGNLTNTAESKQFLIGGDLVPSDVVATNNNEHITDPSKQAHVTWSASKQSPEFYQLQAYICPEMREVEDLKKVIGEHYLFEDLNAGTCYVFKVMAVHGGNPTSGCSSNQIVTHPLSMKVANVKADIDHRTDTTQIVNWEEMTNDANGDEIKYLVHLRSDNNSIVRQEEANVNTITFLSLRAATTYYVKVCAMNSRGTGQWSDECAFETDIEKPRNVRLELEKKSLILKFEPAKGPRLRHIYQLEVQASNGWYSTVECKELQNEEDPSVFFSDVQPNQFYKASVYAEYDSPNGRIKRSLVAESNEIRTCPSKVDLKTHQCHSEHGQGCREMKIAWKSQRDIEYYKVSITEFRSSAPEIVLCVTDKCEVIYFCKQEATKYHVQVCAKNDTGFGDSSDVKTIILAPSKLQGIRVKYDEDGSFIVRCKSPSDTATQYWMTVLCEEKVLEERVAPTDDYENEEPCDDDNLENRVVSTCSSDLITWLYTPAKPAKAYVFELFAENENGVAGQPARSDPIVSKPSRASKPSLEPIKNSEGFPTTRFKISWDELEGCDFYAVCVYLIKEKSHEQLENCINCNETETIYTAQRPGSTYRVRISGVAGFIYGDESDNSEEVKLVPDKVQLMEDITHKPVDKIIIRWKKLHVPPDGYKIKLFHENDEKPSIEIDRLPDEDAECTVNGMELRPGHRYYYQVSAYNETPDGIEFAKPATSKQIVIAWRQPDLTITPDEKCPYQKAKIEWGKPEGVNFYELEIQNKKYETVHKQRLEDVLSYVFEGGLPGNVYSFRLYCGYNSVRDENFVERTMTMHPLPPSNIKVTADQDNTRLIVEFNDTPSFHKEYIIQWKCLSKGFEHTQTSDPIRERRYLVSGLKPGAQYEIAVQTVVSNIKSQYEHYSNIVHTLPPIVEQLQSRQSDDGSIVFCWDHLRIHPTEYIIQWKMNNNDVIEQSTVENIVLIHVPEPGSCYSFRVKAINSSGGGRFSDWNTYFTTPLPPTDIKVTADQDNCRLLVAFTDMPSFHKEYKIQCRCLSPGFEKTKRLEGTKDHFAVLYDLLPGALYEVAVQTVVSNEQSSYAYSISNTETLPSQIQNVRVRENGDGTILFEWDRLNPPPVKYNVLWKLNNQHVNNESTTGNSFCVYNPEPESCYSLCVKASNNSGCGRLSEWHTHFTRPLPPRDIRVTADKFTCRLHVEFDDTTSFHKEYKLQYRCLSTGFEEIKTSDRTKEHFAVISGLIPGAIYEVAVMTIVSDTKSQYAYCGHNVETLPNMIQNCRSTEKDDGVIMYEWDHLDIHPSEYIVQWKMNNQDHTEERTVGNHLLIYDTEPGNSYNLRVKAINSSGCGGFSEWVTHFTRPDSPTGLSVECLSPVLVKIRCDPVKRATSYTFDVNGDCYNRKTPLLLYKNNKASETLQINVCATIKNKWGSPSETLLFKHYLLHLKKKFLRIAKNQFEYLPLEFQNLATGIKSISFQSGLSDIEKGQTCLVVGEYCTGKTATCCHCIENLDDGQLGLYLDYEDFRGNERKMSVETVIGDCMKDLDHGEITSVLNWMKENSELVVFFLENVSFPTKYTSKIIHYGDVTEKEDIFYNLTSTRREIFPDARIICTTCDENMDILLHPTTTLQISGCCDEQIQDVTKEIFGDEKENSELHEAIRYFCINPFYRNIILKLGKMGHGLGSKTLSDMAMILLEESINRLSYRKRIARLENFVAAILRFQSHCKVGETISIPAMTSQDLTCKRLHEDVMKALYFVYFCPSKEFKLVFAGKGGIVVPLASGLLEETRTKRLEEFFRPAGNSSVKVKEKLDKMEEHLNNQMKKMHQHAYSNHRVALSLLQSNIELGYRNRKMNIANIELEITNSLNVHTVNEVARFLAKVQEDFCPCIKLKPGKNLSTKIADTIDHGIGNNRFTKENTTEYVSSHKKEFRIWKRQTQKPTLSKAEDHNELQDTGHHNQLLIPEDLESERKSKISSQGQDGRPQANFENQANTYRAPSHTDLYPFEKITESVGPDAKTIHIGGCSVTFPRGCFHQTQLVTVAAEINPNGWPDGKVGVTPTLDITAHSMMKKAKVRLTTWCLPGDETDDMTVDVLYSGGKHICNWSVDASRTIEFESDHFCKLGGFLSNLWFYPSPYAMIPVLYYSKNKFAVAMILDNDTIIKKCLAEIRENFQDPDVKNLKYNVFSCLKNDSVLSSLSCTISGFEFHPSAKFTHKVSDIFECTGYSIAQSILRSEKESQSVVMEIDLTTNGFKQTHAFSYDWVLERSSQMRLTSSPCPACGIIQAQMVNYGTAVSFNSNCRCDIRR